MPPIVKMAYLILLAVAGIVPAFDLAQQAAATLKVAAEQQAQQQAQHAEQQAQQQAQQAEQEAQQAVDKREQAQLDVVHPLMVVFGLGAAGLCFFSLVMAKARVSFSGGNVPPQLLLTITLALGSFVVPAVIHLANTYVAGIKYNISSKRPEWSRRCH